MIRLSQLFCSALRIVLAVILSFTLIPLWSDNAYASEPTEEFVWSGEKDPAWFEDQLAALHPLDDIVEIHISQASELASFAAWANENVTHDAEKVKVVLDNDIILNDENSTNAWDPIQQFDGVFDGGGHSIKGILININSRYPDTSHYGFGYDGYAGFIAMSKGVIENLSLYGHYDATLGLDASYMVKEVKTLGGFVGRLVSGGVVENCSNHISMEKKEWISRAGVVGISAGLVNKCSNYSELVGVGVVGASWGGSVASCTNYANITGNDGSSSTCGIVGAVSDGAVASDCINLGDLTWSGYDFGISGVAGNCDDAVIERCANYGDITVAGWEGNYWPTVGGLVGSVSGGTVVIRESFNCGTVRVEYPYRSEARVGSLIGELLSTSSLELVNCYNTGTVDLAGTEHVFAGGVGSYLVFETAPKGTVVIKACYNVGAVINAPYEVPAFFNSVSVDEFMAYNALYSAERFKFSFTESSALGIAMKDVRLKSEETLADLNSQGEYWKTDDHRLNDGYPVLKWEVLDHATTQPPIPVPDAESATVYYDSEFEQDDFALPRQVDVSWDSSLFVQPATTYNHRLAQLGSALSAMTYAEGRYVNDSATGTVITSVEDGRTQLTEYPSNTSRGNSFVFRTLRGMGFSDHDIENYYYRDEERVNDYDTVGYTLATKEITVEGKARPLVMVLVRGTGANAEWMSNTNVSDTLMDYDNYHEGFKLAAEEVEKSALEFLEAKGIRQSDARFFVTGHSRGAAVANIVAAALSSNWETQTNVYGYTFAAPNCVSTSLLNDDEYNNIFNIVNPEDIVSRVPLVKWGYGKYGVTLYTPSSSNASGYHQKYLPMMREEFGKLTDSKRYEPYATGSMSAKLLTDLVYSICPEVSELYRTKFSFTHENSKQTDFSSLITLIKACTKMAFVDDGSLSSSEMLAVVFGAGEALAVLASIVSLFGFVPVFVGAGAAAVAGLTIAPCVTNAHTVETYMAWMMSSDSVSIYKSRYKGLSVACPVNVYIKDADGNLVVKIENDVVDEGVMAKGLPAMVDKDGVKRIDIPNDGDYFVSIKATADGEMDYSIGEFEGDDTAIRKIAFYDIPLVAGRQFEGSIPEGSENQTVDFSLVSDGVKQIDPDADLSGERLTPFEISVNAEGEGDVSGNALVLEGDLVSVDAMAFDGSVFNGWYERNELVSEAAHFTFRAERPRALIAKFALPDDNEGEGKDQKPDGPQQIPSVDYVGEGEQNENINSSPMMLADTGDRDILTILAGFGICISAATLIKINFYKKRLAQKSNDSAL